MNRDYKRPVKRAVYLTLTMLLTSTSVSAQPAPIRYGHGAGGSNTGNSQSYKPEPRQQYTSLTTSTTYSGSDDDPFFYPDEDINDRSKLLKISDRTPEPEKVYSAPTAPVAGNLPSLPQIDPVDYQSYVKIGNPYTVNGVTYTPKEDPFYNETGTASWYGPDFHGNLTANGETYDMMSMSAAHPTLPLPCYVLVINRENGKQVVVRVNDRGPFKKGRVIDLSRAAAERLEMIDAGTADVRVQYLGPAERAGDSPLMTSDPIEPFQIAEATLTPPPATKQIKSPRPTMPDAHFVQLGSFASRDNANGLLAQVSGDTDLGAVVFANVNGADRYRVVLGPYSSKSEADNARLNMSRRGFDGIVIRNP